MQGPCAARCAWRIDVSYSIMLSFSRGILNMTGAGIRDLRKTLGYTQARLAEEVGITANTVARYERDELRPSPPVMKLLKLLEMLLTEKKAA